MCCYLYYHYCYCYCTYYYSFYLRYDAPTDASLPESYKKNSEKELLWLWCANNLVNIKIIFKHQHDNGQGQHDHQQRYPHTMTIHKEEVGEGTPLVLVCQQPSEYQQQHYRGCNQYDQNIVIFIAMNITKKKLYTSFGCGAPKIMSLQHRYRYQNYIILMN